MEPLFLFYSTKLRNYLRLRNLFLISRQEKGWFRGVGLGRHLGQDPGLQVWAGGEQEFRSKWREHQALRSHPIWSGQQMLCLLTHLLSAVTDLSGKVTDRLAYKTDVTLVNGQKRTKLWSLVITLLNLRVCFNWRNQSTAEYFFKFFLLRYTLL